MLQNRSFPLFLLAAAMPLTAQTWTQLAQAPFPQPTTTSSRNGGGAAFSIINGGVILYGGLQTGVTAPQSDTWLFDGTTWTQLQPATTPPVRWGHQMVYDSVRYKVITFGGRSPTTTATANDTWEWDGSNWAQVITPTAPSARAFYGMAFDDRRGKAVLYGIQSGIVPAGQQTWEYNGTTWTMATPATVPPGLESPAMAYDKGRGVTVMFGGYNATSPGTDYRTTYEWDGVNWTLRTTAAAPLTGYRAALVYDDLHGRILLYGGLSGGVMQKIVWEYDGNNWVQALSGVGPGRATLGYAAYDTAHSQMYFIAGSGPSTAGGPNETWTYSGRSVAIAGPYGNGCSGSGGVPALAATSLPVIGTNYTLTATNLPAGAAAAFVVHGFNNRQCALGALPVDLSLVGFTGCKLEVSPDLSLFTLGFGGTTQSSIAIPNSTSFLDMQLYSQVITSDASASNGNGAVSNAVHAVLGN